MNNSQILDIIKGLKRGLVLVPFGTFLMGSTPEDEDAYENEYPRHLVKVQPFLMSKFPITQLQWRAVSYLSKVNLELKSHPSCYKGDNLPVTNINWYEALEFCNRLSIFTGLDILLSSEAQWEYACRAGTTTQYYWGDNFRSDLLNSSDEYKEHTISTVGSYPSNPWGLYDMHGNLWEWCLDPWHENYEGAPNDCGPWLDHNSNTKRVVRGYCSGSKKCTSSYRLWSSSDLSLESLGFRIVCSL